MNIQVKTLLGNKFVGVLVVTASLALAMAIPSIAAANTSHEKLSLLQQGKNFYAGKTVTLISEANPGSSPNTQAQLVAPLMSTYLHANVVVEAEGGAGGIPAQNAMAASPKDGLTLGQISMVADLDNLLTDSPGLNFNPEHVPFLGALENEPASDIMVSNPTSPFINFNVITSGKYPLSIGTTETGGNVVIFGELANILRLNVNWIHYPTSLANVTGFIRGDEQLDAINTSAVESEIIGGTARAILIISPIRASVMNTQLAAKLKGVPTIAQIFANHHLKSRQEKDAAAFLSAFATYPATVFTTPTGVSADKIAALRAALEFAIKNKATQAAVVTADAGYGYLSGAQVKTDFINATSGLHFLAPYVPKS